MKKHLLFTFILVSINIKAQDISTKDAITSQIVEYLAENGIDTETNTQDFNDLIELSEHKTNIHNVDKRFLEQLIFLSDFQIKDLLNYIKTYRPIYSRYQLQAINSFNPGLIEALSLFVSFEEETTKHHKNYFNANILIRDSYDFETPIGYNKKNSTGYLGNKHHLYQKTIFEYGSNISAGLVYEKDPGEKLTDDKNNPEFLSGYIQYESNKTIENIIIGDFNVNFGQGLAIWSGSNIGKGGDIFLIKKRGDGIRKYSSTNESDFLRGIASSIKWHDLKLTSFISTKDIDANIEYDSINNLYYASSFPSSGYHRTISELSKKNKANRKTYGANLQYRLKNLTLSIGSMYQETNINNAITPAIYKSLNYLHSNSQNSFFAYNYGRSNFIIFGEVATTSNFDIALTNGVLIKPTSSISTSLLYRNFSKKYNSPWLNAFSESSNPNGESGLFIGISAYPIPNVEIQSSIDIFKFNWLEYNINKPSNGYEILLKTVYKANSQTKISFQYKEKDKARNISDSEYTISPIENYNLKKVRTQIDFETSTNISLQCRFEKSFYNSQSTNSSGLLAYCNLSYRLPKPKLSFSIRYGVFDTDDYNARIYAYENDVLYNFSIPSFQDKGSRAYLLSKLKIKENITLWLKFAQTWYSNKKEIGSGLQTINSNTKTNLKIQLQIKI